MSYIRPNFSFANCGVYVLQHDFKGEEKADHSIFLVCVLNLALSFYSYMAVRASKPHCVFPVKSKKNVSKCCSDPVSEN